MATKLDSLSEKEARRIGRSLISALRLRKTGGLYQWKTQNKCMVEFFEKRNWAESMMLEVAHELLKTAPWGLAWRVCVGATLSTLDMATDIFVIVGYMRKEETKGYGYSLLWMIIMSMVLQLVVVVLQNAKRPWVMVKEALFVVTGLKPVMDAKNVVMSKEMEDHHVIDSKVE